MIGSFKKRSEPSRSKPIIEWQAEFSKVGVRPSVGSKIWNLSLGYALLERLRNNIALLIIPEGPSKQDCCDEGFSIKLKSGEMVLFEFGDWSVGRIWFICGEVVWTLPAADCSTGAFGFCFPHFDQHFLARARVSLDNLLTRATSLRLNCLKFAQNILIINQSNHSLNQVQSIFK